MNETNNQIRGGDPRKAILCRWTLDRLYKQPDLIERLMQEEFKMAWNALSKRAARACLFKALEMHPEVQSELAVRSGLLRVVPNEAEEVKSHAP